MESCLSFSVCVFPIFVMTAASWQSLIESSISVLASGVLSFQTTLDLLHDSVLAVKLAALENV
jgi:hypothetical protein